MDWRFGKGGDRPLIEKRLGERCSKGVDERCCNGGRPIDPRPWIES